MWRSRRLLEGSWELTQRTQMQFKLSSTYEPGGEYPEAIRQCVRGIAAGDKNQVQLRVTGCRKTFTRAKVIEASGRRALVVAQNKTLAAELISVSRLRFKVSGLTACLIPKLDGVGDERRLPIKSTHRPVTENCRFIPKQLLTHRHQLFSSQLLTQPRGRASPEVQPTTRLPAPIPRSCQNRLRHSSCYDQ